MAVIYCFTSTGNSLYTARKIAESIGAEVRPITYKSVTADDDVIGVVFPVFYLGVPKIVRDFATRLTVKNPNAYIFAVATYGNAAFGAVDEIRKCLCGRELSYAASVKYVENYLPEFKVNNTAEAHNAAEERILSIIGDITARKKKRGGHYTAIHRVFRRIFYGDRNRGDCDKKFTVSDACTGCGTCAKVCSAKNITVTAGRPVFSHRCEHCISCLHCCPVAAINYGKTVGRERYVHPEIGVKGLIEFWGKN